MMTEKTKDRFLKEYEDLLKRIIELDVYIANWDDLGEDFEERPSTPIELFHLQSQTMFQYQKILEWRAKIEGITEIYDIQRKYIADLAKKGVE